MGDRRNEDRRAPEDRRQVVERRKASENRRAVFEVCRSTLHLALLVPGDGNKEDRIITRSIRWRKESNSVHTEDGARELTDAFRTLVSEERLVGASARIALNGEFCVTRVVAGPSEQVRRELHELEERTSHYLLLGPGPKAIAQSKQQLDARHQHALMSVANQNTLQLLAEIAGTVGLNIEVIEPSMVALSRAQARLPNDVEEACLIIQLDEGEAELGVCHEGRLMLEYRPGGGADSENIAHIVAEHLERLHRYLARQHGYRQPLEHVFLTGEPAAVERARLRFEQSAQFRTHVFDPGQLDVTWQYSDGTPGTEYAAALGTTLSYYPTEAQQLSPNLMEQMLVMSREPLRPFLVRCLIPLAAVVLVAIGLLLLWGRERVSTALLQAEMERFAPARARAAELQLNLVRAENKITQLTKLEQKLPKIHWGLLIQHIGQSMPGDVWLDRVSFQDGKAASLAGASYTDGGVYDFVSYLKQVPQVSQIDLTGTGVGRTPTGTATSFDLKLSLVEPTDSND